MEGSLLLRHDLVTSLLELLAVVLFAVGTALAVAGLVGGLVGGGCGLVSAAVVLGAASTVIQLAAAPPGARR